MDIEDIDLKMSEQDLENGDKQLTVVKEKRKREIDKITDDPTDVKKHNYLIDEAEFNNPMWSRYVHKEIGPDKIAHALLAARGNRTKAAKLAGCTYQTVYNYIREYPEVREVLHMCEEVRGDMYERLADEKALRGDSYMIWNVLKTRYKKRGYVESIEVQRVNPPTFKYEVVPARDMTLDVNKEPEDIIKDDAIYTPQEDETD